jgi:hypothetical protein
MDRIGGLKCEDLRKNIKAGPVGGYLFGIEHRDYIRVRSFIDIRRKVEAAKKYNYSAFEYNRSLTRCRHFSEAIKLLAASAIATYTGLGLLYLIDLWPKPLDIQMLSTMPQAMVASFSALFLSRYTIKLARDAANLHDFLVQASYPNGPRIDPRNPS